MTLTSCCSLCSRATGNPAWCLTHSIAPAFATMTSDRCNKGHRSCGCCLTNGPWTEEHRTHALLLAPTEWITCQRPNSGTGVRDQMSRAIDPSWKQGRWEREVGGSRDHGVIAEKICKGHIPQGQSTSPGPGHPVCSAMGQGRWGLHGRSPRRKKTREGASPAWTHTWAHQLLAVNLQLLRPSQQTWVRGAIWMQGSCKRSKERALKSDHEGDVNLPKSQDD